MLYNVIYEVISTQCKSSALYGCMRMLGLNAIRVLFVFIYGPCNAAYCSLKGSQCSLYTHTHYLCGTCVLIDDKRFNGNLCFLFADLPALLKPRRYVQFKLNIM